MPKIKYDIFLRTGMLHMKKGGDDAESEDEASGDEDQDDKKEEEKRKKAKADSAAQYTATMFTEQRANQEIQFGIV